MIIIGIQIESSKSRHSLIVCPRTGHPAADIIQHSEHRGLHIRNSYQSQRMPTDVNPCKEMKMQERIPQSLELPGLATHHNAQKTVVVSTLEASRMSEPLLYSRYRAEDTLMCWHNAWAYKI